MTAPRPRSRRAWLLVPLLIAAAAGGGYAAYAHRHRPASGSVSARPPIEPIADEEPGQAPPLPTVSVVHPKAGDMDRTTTQPGTVQAFESAQLYAGVSGYLKSQSVDIGDRVKPGQVLATVDVPELEKQVQRCSAALEQARARVRQMQARVVSARADQEAAQAQVAYADANAKSKAAELRFRQKQLDRMKELWAKDRAVDERLVDEKTEQRDAAQEAERAAVAAIAAAKAVVAAAAAKVEQARVDVVEAESEVKVAQADLEKAQVMVRFGTILAPFAGVITHRSLFPGDYVRAAGEGNGHLPLLSVERTDRMRVIVQVPDRDVPYADPGDAAVVEVDALPGEKFPAKVSRIAGSEDPQTRMMRVEIDMPNPTGKIRQGMYGRVTIILEKSNLLSVPSPCLASRSDDGRAVVYVVRGERAVRTAVRISEDNGVKVGILSGLKPDDLVVLRPPSGLGEEAPVTVADSDGQPANP